MYCLSCGAELEPGTRYCPKCGAPRNADAASGLGTDSPSSTSAGRVSFGAGYGGPTVPTSPIQGLIPQQTAEPIYPSREVPDYRWAVWVSAILYLFLFPGLVLNIVMLNRARNWRDANGVAPRGLKGLQILLAVGVFLVIIGLIARATS